jgi:hypothetical protein
MLTRSLVVCFAFMCARAELMRQARCLQIMTRAGGRWAESPIALMKVSINSGPVPAPRARADVIVGGT